MVVVQITTMMKTMRDLVLRTIVTMRRPKENLSDAAKGCENEKGITEREKEREDLYDLSQ